MCSSFVRGNSYTVVFVSIFPHRGFGETGLRLLSGEGDGGGGKGQQESYIFSGEFIIGELL